MKKVGLLAAIMVVLSTAVAHAVVVDFSPGFRLYDIYRIRSDGEFVDGRTRLDNLSIIASQVRTSASGSGFTLADLDDWTNDQRSASARLRATVGPGLGSASVSISSIATFDLLFPGKGDYYFEVGYGIFGDGSGLRHGETASADWSVFLEFDPDQVDIFYGSNLSGDVNSVECPGSLCDTFFDGNFEPFDLRVEDDLRLPVRAVINFDISATAISEPTPITLIAASALIAGLLFGRARKRRISGLAT